MPGEHIGDIFLRRNRCPSCTSLWVISRLRHKMFRAISFRASHPYINNNMFHAILSRVSRFRAHKSSLHSHRYSRICVWSSKDFSACDLAPPRKDPLANKSLVLFKSLDPQSSHQSSNQLRDCPPLHAQTLQQVSNHQAPRNPQSHAELSD